MSSDHSKLCFYIDYFYFRNIKSLFLYQKCHNFHHFWSTNCSIKSFWEDSNCSNELYSDCNRSWASWDSLIKAVNWDSSVSRCFAYVCRRFCAPIAWIFCFSTSFATWSKISMNPFAISAKSDKDLINVPQLSRRSAACPDASSSKSIEMYVPQIIQYFQY